MDNKKTMKKNLGVMTATTLVIGSVIGAGVFFKPYAIYQATGGAPGMGLLAWVIGGILSILGALTFAEVAVMIPKTGGMVTYLSEVFGEKVGFLAGWMLVIIFYPAFLAGYGVKVGSELAEFLGAGWALPIGILTIMTVVILNVVGSKTAGKFQIVSTVCKLIPLFLIMVLGFLVGDSDASFFLPVVGEGKTATGALGATLIAVLFAFEGWTNVGTIAGEMKNPGRDLPRAIVGGVSIIMAVYILINLAYLQVIPANELMNIESPAAAVANVIFGPKGGMVIKLGIVISVIGAANGFLLSGSRVCYQLATTGKLPFSSSLSKLNEQLVPANSIILLGFLGCIYSISGKFDTLTDLAVFSCWIFYTLTFITVIKLRQDRPDAERKYRVPLYPIVPIGAILGGAYVLFSQLFLSGMGATILAIIGVAITLTGLPVYSYMSRKH